MISKEIVRRIFGASYIKRWRGKCSPPQFVELDKQSHKMIVAYLVARLESEKHEVNWLALVQESIFDLLQRTVTTDLKPSISRAIEGNKSKAALLNQWIYQVLEPEVSCIDQCIVDELKAHLEGNGSGELHRQVLDAAHVHVSRWELQYLRRFNPDSEELDGIVTGLDQEENEHRRLDGFDRFLQNENLCRFASICGELRFQTRWSHVHRVPESSVLGHCYFVAAMTYLASFGLRWCDKRILNNFFTGLFHDLPEVVTSDIMSPLKTSVAGLAELIEEYQRTRMATYIYSLLPVNIRKEIEFFSQDEFSTVATVDGVREYVSSERIDECFNSDEYEPRDGVFVKAMDHLGNFIETDEAIRNGCANEQLRMSRQSLFDRYRRVVTAGVDIGHIYSQFDE